MITYLYIIKGPLEGFRFKVKHGLTLGREESHVNLKDMSISKQHAILGKAPDGPYFIQDQNSGLGTYRNGVRVKQASINEGDKIRLGKTTLLVKEMQPEVSEVPSTDNAPTDQWLDVIKEKYKILSMKGEDKPINLVPMFPIVKLTFIKGLQLGTEWIIGYGPRIIGRASLDLRVLEPEAFNHCFELIPTEDGPLYQTDHSKEVLLNGESIKNKILKDSDIISFLDTKIKIGLMQ